MAREQRIGYGSGMDPRLARHVAACNNVHLPGDYLAFGIGGEQVGWVLPEVARALAGFAGVTTGPRQVMLAADAAGDLPAIGRALSEQGFGRWRGEAFDVRASREGPVLGTLDRGMLPPFGVLAIGVHVNGLVEQSDGPHLWVARRAANRPLDPGKLDHLVAGGVHAAMTPRETLVKEAAEEAAVPADLAAQAVETGLIGYTMRRPEGLRRDWLVCYDLRLPKDFTPVPADGESESFELWPIGRVLARVRDTDDFKFNVNLVLIDLFRRLGLD